ncbi:Acetyltransferase (GNAT) family protein [Chitinophaga jiangningensis]|uniref:Acetyltransferase (GNAT) family protein n=1 Tax=Chitinophaga jiangningensis TaxID=1419482 RepID=A0A1M7AMA3_9BACT|nr:GNAT family N-acetyltransferase [Chitinophaga jiangningensis]SHL43901.1 Acetyltransferase (GNAT) family protein [Chitinophaga jiangningensis]
MQVHYANEDEQINACIDAILALRPQLKREEVLPQVKEMQETDGYMLVYIMDESDSSRAAAIAGFRRLNKLLGGPHFYIDDLSTLPEFQGKGYARKLLDHIRELAVKQGMQSVRLSSGHGNKTAHRLYLNYGFYISAHNFMLPLQ